MHPCELAGRIGMVIHPDISEDAAGVVAGARRMDDQRGALAAARVSTRRVAGQDRGEEPLVECLARRGEERTLHLGDDIGPGEDVALDGVRLGGVALCDATSPVHALASRVRGGTVRPDSAQLTGLSALVRSHRRVERRLHPSTTGKRGKDLCSVRDAGERLRRDGADADPYLGDDRPHAHELAGDCDAPGVSGMSGDGESHVRTVGKCRRPRDITAGPEGVIRNTWRGMIIYLSTTSRGAWHAVRDLHRR
jgi:hypothetical protein